jgi:hypothetical protein
VKKVLLPGGVLAQEDVDSGGCHVADLIPTGADMNSHLERGAFNLLYILRFADNSSIPRAYRDRRYSRWRRIDR